MNARIGIMANIERNIYNIWYFINVCLIFIIYVVALLVWVTSTPSVSN
jgi:hypothetical protein